MEEFEFKFGQMTGKLDALGSKVESTVSALIMLDKRLCETIDKMDDRLRKTDDRLRSYEKLSENIQYLDSRLKSTNEQLIKTDNCLKDIEINTAVINTKLIMIIAVVGFFSGGIGSILVSIITKRL